jgi:hypothetical protein
MKGFLRSRRLQQGAALMLLITVLVLGIAWYTVGALGKAAPTRAERDVRTAAALQAAKEALLGYVALRAAEPTEENPGRLPCPENPGQPGTAQEGIAAPFPGFPNCTQVGRLPWKTLGIDQLRDAEGEPLWYAVATGTWALLTSTTPTLSINPGLANQLNYDVSPLPAPNVVAVIIAPGKSLNTLSAGAPPAGCTPLNQHANRYAVPYVAAKFLECGNEAANYRKAGPAGWSNDHSISITAAEVMDAIMGAVAERVQRQVAPAMNDWYNVQSPAIWGQSFLPYASTFDSLATNPSVNDLCGDDDRRDGMPPTATVASGTCDTKWFYADVTGISFTTTCTPNATEMRCTFSCLLCGLLTPRVTVAANNIGNTFRSFDRTQVKVDVNGLLGSPGNVQNYSAGVTSGKGSAIGYAQFDVALPLLSVAATVTIRVPHPVDAALADDRMRWFVVNGWDRFTYYAVPRAVTLNSGPDKCQSSNTSDCIRVNGMPDPTDRKRLVLVLMGQRALAPMAWPGANAAAYLEAGNATPADRLFDANRVTSAAPPFNDRIAACPHTLVTASGNFVACSW